MWEQANHPASALFCPRHCQGKTDKSVINNTLFTTETERERENEIETREGGRRMKRGYGMRGIKRETREAWVRVGRGRQRVATEKKNITETS